MTPITSSQGLRHPRSFFEKKLRKILERVSKGEWVNLYWKSVFRDVRQAGKTRPVALWAVGSFARGAEFCGDLDLVVQAETVADSCPPDKTIRNALTGVHPYVRTYIGTPEENSSYASFDDAVLLWSEEQPDWEKALMDIQANPDEGRHEREWDAIPFRMEQICINDPDELLEQKKAGVIDWQWIEWDELAGISGVEENIPKRRLERMKLSRSSKYDQCLDLASKWLSHKESPDAWEYQHGNDCPQIVGGHALTISPVPGLWLSYLNKPTCHTVLIMPYKTKRGPNGMWVITRGANHPYTQGCDA